MVADTCGLGAARYLEDSARWRFPPKFGGLERAEWYVARPWDHVLPARFGYSLRSALQQQEVACQRWLFAHPQLACPGATNGS